MSGPTGQGTVSGRQFLWGVGLPKGNGGVQRFPRARRRLALECKGRRELDCKTHPSSRDESGPTVPSGRAFAQGRKVTLGITGWSSLSLKSANVVNLLFKENKPVCYIYMKNPLSPLLKKRIWTMSWKCSFFFRIWKEINWSKSETKQDSVREWKRKCWEELYQLDTSTGSQVSII